MTLVSCVLLLSALLAGVVLAALRGGSALLRSGRLLLRARRMTASLPGPPGEIPVLGHLGYFLCPMDDLYDRIASLCGRCAPLFRIWLGHMTIVVATEPDDIEAVLSNPEFVDKPAVYSILQQSLGSGIAFLNGEDWRRRRKALTPFMHLEVLRHYVAAFQRNADRLAVRLGVLADEGVVFDVKPLCGDLANSAICETMMSMDVNTLKTSDPSGANRASFLAAVPKILEHTMYRACRPWLLTEWTYSFTGRFSEYRGLKETLDDFTRTIINAKKKTRKQESTSPLGDRPWERGHHAFLDHILSSNASIPHSDTELADEVKSLVFIGSGSSMDTLAFIFYTLAIEQDVQEKIFEELVRVLGGDGTRPVEPSDLPHLVYLENVIKEVLRFFPAVAFFGRQCARDLRLPSSGFVLPRGSQVMFWAPHVHMDPRWFPEPASFRPERFLREHADKRHPFAYLAFSGGPRSCYGHKYAMMFLKTVTATLVSRLRFVLPEGRSLQDVRLKLALTLSIRDGANLKVLRRSAACGTRGSQLEKNSSPDSKDLLIS